MFIFCMSRHTSVLAINKLMPAQIWSNLTFFIQKGLSKAFVRSKLQLQAFSVCQSVDSEQFAKN